MAITTIVNETMTIFNCKATLQSSHAFSEKYSQSLKRASRTKEPISISEAKLKTQYFHFCGSTKKSITKLWIHKNINSELWIHKTKWEAYSLKCGSTKNDIDFLWIHKKTYWIFVDPQKLKTRLPLENISNDQLIGGNAAHFFFGTFDIANEFKLVCWHSLKFSVEKIHYHCINFHLDLFQQLPTNEFFLQHNSNR